MERRRVVVDPPAGAAGRRVGVAETVLGIAYGAGHVLEFGRQAWEDIDHADDRPIEWRGRAW